MRTRPTDDHRRHQWRASGPVLLAVAVLTLLTMGSSPAQQGSTATCHLTWELHFSPGISTTQQVSRWTSRGPTGTADCDGEVNGFEVTGQGTSASTGAYDGSCLGGTAEERLTLHIPTTGGLQTLNIETDLQVLPGAGVKESDAFVGLAAFVFHATEGDCVTEPIRTIAVDAGAIVES